LLRIPADLTPLKSKDFLNRSQFLVFVELIPTNVLDVQHFITKREVTPLLTTINREACNSRGCRLVTISQDESSLRRLGRAGSQSNLKLRETAKRFKLRAIARSS
jgi:hypothetical protein